MLLSQKEFWDVAYEQSLARLFAAMDACPQVEEPEVGAHVLFPVSNPEGGTYVLWLIGTWAKPLDLQRRIPALCGKPTMIVYSDGWSPHEFALKSNQAGKLALQVQAILDQQGIIATLSLDWEQWAGGPSKYNVKPSDS